MQLNTNEILLALVGVKLGPKVSIKVCKTRSNLGLLSIVSICILHCTVIAHLPSDIIGAVGVVDVDLGGRPPDVSHLLALDQADDKEDQKCNEKCTC